MKIFMTGSTGFLGSLLAKKLVEEGHDVVGLTRDDSFRDNTVSGVRYFYGDLLKRETIKEALKLADPEVIFHLAALTAVRESFSRPLDHAATNYLGTINLVEEAKKLSLEKFIYASTPEVYRSVCTPIKEDAPAEGETPYGISKTAADLYVRYAGKAFGLPYVIMRHANSFGRPFELPEEARGYLIEKAVLGMLSDEPEISFDGMPDRRRSWIYYKDVVRAYELLLKTDSKFETWHFSAGSNSVGGIVDTIKEITDYKGKIEWNQNPRPFDPPSLVIDDSKAREKLGWAPLYSIKAGLEETVDYWRGRLG